MTIGRPLDRRSAVRLLATASLLAAGCASPGPIATKRMNTSALKASLGRLENENDTLKREVADLNQENRTVHDQIVQVEAKNGDLKAKLDDARNLIAGRDPSLGSTASLTGSDSSPVEESATRPVKRPTRKPRKPPTANIRNRVDLDTSEDDPLAPPRDDRQGSTNEQSTGWLPVAKGPKASSLR